MDRRAFLAGTGAVLLAAPLAAEAQDARNEVRRFAQEPATPGLVCPGNTYWNGQECTSGRRPASEDQFVEIVTGKTTKQEILALFGEPAYRWADGSGQEVLIYYMDTLGPPYPMWFRHTARRDRKGMLEFWLDHRGLFLRSGSTTLPSP